MRILILILTAALTAQAQSQAQNIARSTMDRLPRKVIVGTLLQHHERLSPDLKTRLEELARKIDDVAAQSQKKYGRAPDIVVLPETVVSRVEPLPYAGAVETAFAALARKHHSYIVVPMMLAEGATKANAAILVDRAGKQVGIYRKMHLAVTTNSDSLEDRTTPGKSVAVFETDFGKLGIQICFDMVFDYGWAELQRQGAELVVWPSDSPQTGMPAARARQHGYYIVSSTPRNNVAVFEPTGKITAQAKPPETALVEEIDLSYAILPWSEPLRNGAAMKARYGDKVGFRYYEDEDRGIFWSNDPHKSIGAMVREMGLAEAAPELERIKKLYGAAGVPAYR